MQKIITSYRILQEKSEISLQIEVLKLLQLGWQPQGGVHAGQSYTQAMVKYENN
jgi:Domain of unknown function (DUF1737)